MRLSGWLLVAGLLAGGCRNIDSMTLSMSGGCMGAGARIGMRQSPGVDWSLALENGNAIFEYDGRTAVVEAAGDEPRLEYRRLGGAQPHYAVRLPDGTLLRWQAARLYFEDRTVELQAVEVYGPQPEHAADQSRT